MSLFRRKQERKDARDEHVSEQPDRAAEERDPETEPEPGTKPESARPDEDRSPGVIVAPVAGEIVSGVVEVQVAASETAAESVLLEWSADGSSWRRAGADKRQEEAKGELLHWDTGSLDDGSYSLRLVAVLPDGRELAGEPVSALVDNVGPEIHLREPLEGQTLSGFVSIAVEAEDSVSDVSVVELEISDGGEDWRRIAEARAQPFELRWSSEALPDGDYRLRIDARDGSGNLNLIGPFEVEIANVPVAAELVDPGELLRGRINLIARTPDLLSTQMIFELAKAGSSDWRALGTTRAPFHLPVDTAQIDDGSYELRIESITVEGKSIHSHPFGPYVVDNTPPAITITKPAAGETLKDRAELLVEVADNASGPALVELSYNEGGEWITLARLEPENGTVRGFWQLAECRPGSCRLRAKAQDQAGNEASEEITVTIAASAPPERASEPVSIPVRPLLPAVANRFGQIPSWDWKRQQSSAAAQAGATASEAVEQAKTAQPSAEPAPPTGAKAEPVAATVPRERVKKSAAWTWKSSPPRSEPAASERSKPEDEPISRAKAEREHPAEPEPEPKKENELEATKELEPDAQGALDEQEPARVVRLVDSLPREERAEIEQENEKESPDSGAEQGARVVNVNFARAAHGWDIWALDTLVEETPDQDPAREEERRQTLYYLRQHTSVDGRIPPVFEDLIYELFGELMPDDEGA
jgi:hypothetical protein